MRERLTLDGDRVTAVASHPGARVETRLMALAAALDATIQQTMLRVRHDAKAPARSFAGELYLTLVDVYRLGARAAADRRENP